VTIAGYGEPLSEANGESVGRRGRIMPDPDYADLARCHPDHVCPVPAGDPQPGLRRLRQTLDDGRWVCVLTPRLDDVPDA